MRPRINPACINPKAQVFSKEIYTIKGRPDVKFYHRKDAIEKTIVFAIKEARSFVIQLNDCDFCLILSDGSNHYIYNPAIDNVTDNKLKSFFISRGFVMAHYGKVA